MVGCRGPALPLRRESGDQPWPGPAFARGHRLIGCVHPRPATLQAPQRQLQRSAEPRRHGPAKESQGGGGDVRGRAGACRDRARPLSFLVLRQGAGLGACLFRSSCRALQAWLMAADITRWWLGAEDHPSPASCLLPQPLRRTLATHSKSEHRLGWQPGGREVRVEEARRIRIRAVPHTGRGAATRTYDLHTNMLTTRPPLYLCARCDWVAACLCAEAHPRP